MPHSGSPCTRVLQVKRSGLARLGRLSFRIVFFLCPDCQSGLSSSITPDIIRHLFEEESSTICSVLAAVSASIPRYALPSEKRNSRTEERPVNVLRSKCGARAGVYACIELPYADELRLLFSCLGALLHFFAFFLAHVRKKYYLCTAKLTKRPRAAQDTPCCIVLQHTY